ncbi:hypothetical protein HPB51_028507 [Rhipicephalus microplus]|uniref:Uncharacterized protein n=1 Tax=Rhipicephalus microplus TaxID=6941 RepID=A0A9J6CX44_RHIMP|nr:hypothetical protein HPB51_028507 [Rhipicephalus microplus]
MGGRWSFNRNTEATTSARPEGEERGRALEAGACNEDLADPHAGQQPQETEPAETTANSSTGAVVHTLERLVAFHARRIRLAQRAEAPLQVHMPRDIDVRVQRPCHLVFIRDYQQAILGLAGAAYEPEPLVEWETFTRVLLTTHHCISRLSVHISAVQQPRGNFYQGFSLRDGSAVISVEIEAFEDPWRDFMLRCLQYVCRLWNPQQTSVHYSEHGSVPRPDDLINLIHAAVVEGIDLPELNDSRRNDMEEKHGRRKNALRRYKKQLLVKIVYFKDEQREPVVEVSGPLKVLGDRLAERQEHEARPSRITADSPVSTGVETMAHLTALHPWTIRQRDETPTQVRSPRDVEVMVWPICGVEYRLTGQEAFGAPASAAEHPLHLAEWETLMMTALTMHQCIYHLNLVIYAAPRFHGFYQEFSLEDGIAMVLVQVPAIEDPCNEFLLPYLKYLCRMRNLQQTSSVIYQNPYSHPDYANKGKDINPVVDQEGLPEFNDNRFIRILETTMEIPFLQEIEIYFVNSTSTVPSVTREFTLQLTRRGSSHLRSFTYEVDRSLAESLECECQYTIDGTTPVGSGRAVPLRDIPVRPEVAGSTTDTERCLITCTQHPWPHNYVINVEARVRTPVKI